MARQQTSKPRPKPRTLVPQAHGGALKPGGDGVSGGRPPSELRARLRGSLDSRVAILEEIADRPDASPSDRINAISLLARYGLGPPAQEIEHRGEIKHGVVILPAVQGK